VKKTAKADRGMTTKEQATATTAKADPYGMTTI
jgi:hypothetical protein